MTATELNRRTYSQITVGMHMQPTRRVYADIATIHFNQQGCRTEFELMMIGNRFNPAIIVPSAAEWVGCGVKERDG